MTKTFSASVKGWSEKAKRNSRLIVMEASEAVYSAMTERHAGVGEPGGSFVTGKVPVDTGFLANSVHVEISGALVGQGTPDFMGVISGMKIGDSIEAAFTAEYAAAVNYGTAHMAGRFFVNQAVAQWPAFVAAAARRYKD